MNLTFKSISELAFEIWLINWLESKIYEFGSQLVFKISVNFDW